MGQVMSTTAYREEQKNLRVSFGQRFLFLSPLLSKVSCSIMETILKEEFYRLKNEVVALLGKVDRSHFTHLQNYLYFVNYPLASTVESVIILCDNGKRNSADILVRTLFEAHINILYHQLNDSDHRLALSAKSGFDQRLKMLRELRELVVKYPHQKSQDPKNLFSDEYLTRVTEWTEQHWQGILRGNNLQQNQKDLDLRAKVLKCDKEFKGAEAGYFEKMYILIYRQLSAATHLDIEGLQMFVTEDRPAEYSFGDGAGEEHLIGTAIDIYVAFVKDLYENKMLTGERITVLERADGLLKQRAP